jgi:glucokinase
VRPLILGVDLGGTKISLSLWEGDARLAVERWPTLEPRGANIERVVRLARSWLDARSGAEIAAIGVSGGGPVDSARGVLLSMPNRRGWEEAPVVAELEAALGAPAAIENDANACALAEWLFGAGRGSRHMAFLTCSTGIGAGLILDGRLFRGRDGLAGEIGHLVLIPGGELAPSGGRGTLEAYASGAGIARRLAERAGGDPDAPRTAKDLVDRARAGDAFSRAFLAETGAYLGHALSHLVYILNLEVIVLGTIAVGAGDLLLEPVRAALREHLWPILYRGLRVLPAALGADLGDRAAAAVGSERLRPGHGQ